MSKLKEALKQIPQFERAYLHLRGLKDPGIRSRLAVLEALPRRSVGAEIGVHEGDYAAKILTIVKPTLVHLIDPWLHFEDSQYERSHYGGLGSNGQALLDARFARVKKRFSKEISSETVKLYRTTSDDAVNNFDDESLDWVYIDGNHQYEFVLRDLQNYFPKVKRGGIVAGDDYGTEEWWEGGVQKAVDEFVAAQGGVNFRLVGTQFILTK